MHPSLDRGSLPTEAATVYRWFSWLASLAVVMLGVLAILGWLWDIDTLKGVLPDRVTMKLSTAIGMVLGGGSLGLYNSYQQRWLPSRWAKRGVGVGGLLLLLLGTLTLLVYASFLPARLWLFQLPVVVGSLEDLAAGIMAPNTALCFLLMAVALLSAIRRHYEIAWGVSLGVFAVAQLALIGHIYDALLLFEVGSPTGMAINTSAGFLLLSIGTMLSVPEAAGLKQLSSAYGGSFILRWLLPFTLLLPVILGFFVLLLAQTLPAEIEELVALSSVLTGIFFSSIVWWVSNRLNLSERQLLLLQRQLALREQQLQAIFNNQFQFIGLLSTDGMLLDANQTALEFAGLSRKDVLNRPFWQAPWWSLSPQTRERLKDAIATAAQGEFVRYEVEVAGHDRNIFIDFSLKPVFDEHHRVVQIIPEGRDITEQFYLRRRLQETQLQLTTAQRVARIGSWELDVATEGVSWSPQLFDIYGLDPQQPIPSYKKVLQMILPEDRPHMQHHVEQAISNGTPYQLDYRFRRPDGQIIYAEARGEAVRNRQGQAVKLIGTVVDITERKHAEIALEQSRARYAAVVEDQSELICRYRPDNTIRFVNSAYCRYFGLRAEEILGHSYTPVIHPEDRQWVAEQMAHMSPEEPVLAIEHRVIAKEGVRWTEWTIRGLYDQQEKLIEFQSVGRDTTERKQAELALQEFNENLEELVEKRTIAFRHALGKVAEEMEERRRIESALQDSKNQLKLAIAAAPFPIIIHADDGSILQVSQGCVDITGYQAEELTTISAWVERTCADRSNEIKAHIQTLYGLERKRREGEFPIRTRSDEIRIWDFITVPLGTSPGGRRIVMSMAADVTERKIAEAELNRRLDQQETLVRLGRMVLTQTDLDIVFQEVTQELKRCLGTDYCKVLQLIPEENALLLKAGVGWQPDLLGKAKVSTNENSQAGYTLQQKHPVVVEDLDHETRFHGPPLLLDHQIASGMSTVILGTGDQPFGVLGVHSRQHLKFSQEDVNFIQTIANLLADAIARWHNEQRVRYFNATLEQQVQERTQQLEEANQELQAFSYSVSHDLRAPLRAIEGFARILQEDYGSKLDSIGLDYTRRLINAASHLDHLIQDLLSYSKMGRQKISLIPINLNRVLQSVLQSAASDLQQAQAQIEIVDPLPDVLGHYQILWQIFSNLLNNALKFTDADKRPEIKIWAAEKEGQVFVYVEDNGIGIVLEHQKRIFNPFERLHGIEAYPGTGIGLAIVQRGAERMGGQVGVTSTINQGSCFWVELMKAPEE